MGRTLQNRRATANRPNPASITCNQLKPITFMGAARGGVIMVQTLSVPSVARARGPGRGPGGPSREPRKGVRSWQSLNRVVEDANNGALRC
jgi:hypothetical protein